ncbi:MAG: DinB family protein [Planctomycetota bacterium]
MQELRDHVLWLLGGGQAHIGFEQVVEGFPEELRGRAVAGIPHTPWQLLEHLRICQWDILEFSRDAEHVSPEFPDGYWPEQDGPPDAGAWDQSVAAFLEDAAAMQAMVADPGHDLLAPFPWGDGQTLLREALLVADHNAYHLGQLVVLGKALTAS